MAKENKANVVTETEGTEGAGKAAGPVMGRKTGRIVVECPYCRGNGTIRNFANGHETECPGCDGNGMLMGVPVGPDTTAEFNGVDLALFAPNARGKDSIGRIAFLPMFKKGVLNPRIIVS